MPDVTLPPMPTTITPEPVSPDRMSIVTDFLDDFNPDFREHFVCSTYVLYIDEDNGVVAVTQVSPQQRTGDPSAPGGADDMTSTGGNVGSGGHNPSDDSP